MSEDQHQPQELQSQQPQPPQQPQEEEKQRQPQKKKRCTIKIPEGQDLINLVRFAMSSSSPLEAAAASIGVSQRVYAFVRKLLMLKARRVLTRSEEDTVDHALQVLSKDKEFKEAFELTEKIIARHWHEGTIDGEPRQQNLVRAKVKLRKRFENTLFAIREACSNNEEMEVPPSLTRDERREYCDVLIDSMNSLWNIFNKVRGETIDE